MSCTNAIQDVRIQAWEHVQKACIGRLKMDKSLDSLRHYTGQILPHRDQALISKLEYCINATGTLGKQAVAKGCFPKWSCGGVQVHAISWTTLCELYDPLRGPLLSELLKKSWSLTGCHWSGPVLVNAFFSGLRSCRSIKEFIMASVQEAIVYISGTLDELMAPASAPKSITPC